jgi:hypothetical protein
MSAFCIIVMQRCCYTLDSGCQRRVPGLLLPSARPPHNQFTIQQNLMRRPMHPVKHRTQRRLPNLPRRLPNRTRFLD